MKPFEITMTDDEWRQFRKELIEECSEHENIDLVIKFVRKRDPELAQLIANAELAEQAIAAYLREKDGN